MCGTLITVPPPAPRGPRSGWVVLSHPSTLGDLIRQSGGLRLTSRHPGYKDGLRHSQGHPVMTSTPSGLSLRYFRVLPPSIRREPRCVRLSFFHTGTGHRIGGTPLATPSTPQISFTRESLFRRFIRSLSLRPYSLLASQADRTRAAQRPLCTPRLLRPGFQIAGSPRTSAGYDYGAKLRIAPAGLSPASTAASLVAPLPPGSHRLHWHQLTWHTLHRLPPGRRHGRACLPGGLNESAFFMITDHETRS